MKALAITRFPVSSDHELALATCSNYYFFSPSPVGAVGTGAG
jgi:hypothetical protein